jgi:HEAT repeat protein
MTDAIASLLADASGQVRVAAVEALAHLPGRRAFEELTSLTSSEDPDLLRAALVGLGISKRKEALGPLLRAAWSATAATRLVALSALAELGLPDTVSVLAHAAEDSDPGVRTAALAFLAEHPHPAASNELIELLRKNSSSEPLVQALARPVAGRIAVIAAALELADDALAGALIVALARMQTEPAHTQVREALASPNDSVRRAAATALVASGDPLALPGIEHAALHDGDAEVRRICAATLGR